MKSWISCLVVLFFTTKESYSLTCYDCPSINGECSNTLECPSTFDSCYYTNVVNERAEYSCGFSQLCQSDSSGITLIDQAKDQLLAQGYTITCCNTDLCNKAEGNNAQRKIYSFTVLLCCAVIAYFNLSLL